MKVQNVNQTTVIASWNGVFKNTLKIIGTPIQWPAHHILENICIVFQMRNHVYSV